MCFAIATDLGLTYFQWRAVANLDVFEDTQCFYFLAASENDNFFLLFVLVFSAQCLKGPKKVLCSLVLFLRLKTILFVVTGYNFVDVDVIYLVGIFITWFSWLFPFCLPRKVKLGGRRCLNRTVCDCGQSGVKLRTDRLLRTLRSCHVVMFVDCWCFFSHL